MAQERCLDVTSSRENSRGETDEIRYTLVVFRQKGDISSSWGNEHKSKGASTRTCRFCVVCTTYKLSLKPDPFCFYTCRQVNKLSNKML